MPGDQGPSGGRIPRTKQRRRQTKPVTEGRIIRMGVKKVGLVRDGEYIVESIVGKKTIPTDNGDHVHYFVKWKGWGAAHNTWEPVENLQGHLVLEMIKKFEDEQMNGSGIPPVENLTVEPDADKKSRAAKTGQEIMVSRSHVFKILV